MSARTRTAWIALALGLATAAVYAPAIGFEFVRYDDPRFVSENDHVRNGFSLDGLRWAFFEPQLNWHPVTYLSHMLDAEIYGLEPGGHHATSVLLHLTNALLLFGWLRWLTGATWRSAVVAALFALHPLHVESVAWIAERKDVLSAGFGLMALWAYCAFARGAGPAAYTACFAALLLGLLSKPMLVTLPFAFLLLDFWPLERVRGARAPDGSGEGVAWSRLVVEKLPFFALAAASSALTWSFWQDAMRDAAGVPLVARLANAAVSYARYLGKTFWPADLALLYPHPDLAGGTPWSAWQVGGAVLLVAGVTLGLAVAAARARRSRPALMGWLWFAGMLVPVIGIVQVGLQAMADRYTYLPSIGLFIALVWGAAEATRGLRQRHRGLAAAGGACVAALVLGCGIAARVQLGHWRDSVTLFEHALGSAPEHPLLHNNLGNALVDRDRLEEAAAHYRRAIAIKPDYGVAFYNLGNVLRSLGRWAEAEAAYAQARASALRLRGDTDAARMYYERAVELTPRSAVAHQNLGDVLWMLGRREDAIARYRTALELNPESPLARQRLEGALAAPPPDAAP